jgi:hypothetical protein
MNWNLQIHFPHGTKVGPKGFKYSKMIVVKHMKYQFPFPDF